eukprot:53612-Rhodomonas_salina.1
MTLTSKKHTGPGYTCTTETSFDRTDSETAWSEPSDRLGSGNSEYQVPVYPSTLCTRGYWVTVSESGHPEPRQASKKAGIT